MVIHYFTYVLIWCSQAKCGLKLGVGSLHSFELDTWLYEFILHNKMLSLKKLMQLFAVLCVLSRSVISNSLQLHGLCLPGSSGHGDSLGKNIGVG